MHIVLVLVTIRPEMRTEFEAALLHNARESVVKDRGCRRFDVSQHADDPNRWVLHEVYDDPDAHAAHRRAPHFLAYDARGAAGDRGEDGVPMRWQARFVKREERVGPHVPIVRHGQDVLRPSRAEVASNGSGAHDAGICPKGPAKPNQTWDLGAKGHWYRQSFAL